MRFVLIVGYMIMIDLVIFFMVLQVAAGGIDEETLIFGSQTVFMAKWSIKSPKKILSEFEAAWHNEEYDQSVIKLGVELYHTYGFNLNSTILGKFLKGQ